MSAPWPAGTRVIQAAPDRTNVYVHLDVTYASRADRDLRLHIIQPSGDAALLGWEAAFARRYPCVVFVQGSGWRDQPMGSAIAFWSRFAERGYVVALVEYRPSRVAVHPAQVHDAKAAVRWLRRNADAYAIDPHRLAISGDSSGGHVALLVHATVGIPELDDAPDADPADVRAAVAFYAPTDLEQIGNDEAVRLLFGGRSPSEVPDLARTASPAHYLTPGRVLSPVLLVHGTDDDVVPVGQSVEYARALSEAGQRVQLVVVEGGGHGVWPSFFTDDLADVVDDFLAASLSPASESPVTI
ncbi:alpha/beta hydrolase fold domain-containing protein [Tessaracoccus sp. Z1128]